jgi:small subunit ribosomal protein S16
MVVIEHTKSPKSRDYIEILGSHDPINKITQINGERVKYWMGQGAQLSDTAHNMLVSQKIIKGDKVNVLPKKSPIIDEEALKKAEEEKAAAEAAAQEEARAEESDGSDDAEGTATPEGTSESEPAPEEPAKA